MCELITRLPMSVSAMNHCDDSNACFENGLPRQRRHGVPDILAGLTDHQVIALHQTWRDHHHSPERFVQLATEIIENGTAADHEAAANEEEDSTDLECRTRFRERRNAVCYMNGTQELLRNLMQSLCLQQDGEHGEPTEQR